MKISQVPFFYYVDDNTHCYQACIKMVLKFFYPEKDYSWKELEKLTHKIEGLWTWPMQGLMNLNQMDLKVIQITCFDYNKFALFGLDYIKEEWGEDIAKEQEKHSDIFSEKAIAHTYAKSKIHICRPATLDDIYYYIEKGFLLIMDVNLKMLNNKVGYDNHFVVLYGYDDKNVFVHDPGPPPFKSRRVSLDLFIKSWAYPAKRDCTLQAIKKS